MAKSAAALQDRFVMYDLMLLQQASLFSIRNKADRYASRDVLQRLFMDIQADILPEITLEIGAMDARFSKAMAGKGTTAYAFEANTYNHQKFLPEIQASGLPLHYVHTAICDTDGEISFQVKTKVDNKDVSPIMGNNSLLLRNQDTGDFEYETLHVPATRLDSFLKKNDLSKQTFSAWIDVEGALSIVTAGFGTALKNCQSLLVEMEEVPIWDGQMLYGAAMRYFLDQGLIPIARDFESRHQFNVLFVNPKWIEHPKLRFRFMKHFQKGR